MMSARAVQEIASGAHEAREEMIRESE